MQTDREVYSDGDKLAHRSVFVPGENPALLSTNTGENNLEADPDLDQLLIRDIFCRFSGLSLHNIQSPFCQLFYAGYNIGSNPVMY